MALGGGGWDFAGAYATHNDPYGCFTYAHYDGNYAENPYSGMAFWSTGGTEEQNASEIIGGRGQTRIECVVGVSSVEETQ